MSNEPWKDYQAPAQSGPWDEYAEPQTPTQATPAPAAIERPSSFLRRAVGDTAVDLGKGVVGVGEAAVGLGNLVSGGYVGKGLEAIGYDPQTTKKMLEEGYTHERVAANKAVSDAKGFVGTAKALIQNPSSLIGSAVESAPLMLGGGAVARGGAALLGRAGSIAAPGIGGQLAAIPATTAGRIGLAAAGEGLVGAGSAAEGIRQQSDDGLLSAKQTGAALASGAGTAVLGALGGKVAQKLGIGDIDVALAGGAKAAGEAPKNILRRTIEGMVSEGLLEELPQSMQEQMWQNVATEKPLMEGVPEAAAAGALAGGLMGGGFSALSKPDVRPQPAPNAADKSAGTAGQVPAADTSEPMSGVAAPLSGDIPIQPQTPVAQMAANMRMEAQVQRANAKTVLGRAAADATDMQADAVQASDPFNLSGMGATENTDGFTRLGAIAQSLNLDPDAIVAAARADVGDDPKYSLDGLDDRILASYAQSLAPTVQPAQAQDGFPSEGAVGFQPTPVQAPSVEVPSGQANPVEGGGLASERPAATDVAPAHASVSAAGAQAQGVIYALSAERRSRIVDGLQPNTDLDNALNAILIGGINEQGLMDAVRYGAESGRPEIAAAAAAELRNSANSAAKQKPGVPESSPKYAAIAADLARRAQEAAKLADEAEAIASRRATQPAQPAKAEPAAPPPQAASQQSVADQSQAASLPAIAQEVGGQDRQVEQAGLGSPATDAGTPQAETQTSLGPSPQGTPVEGGGQPNPAETATAIREAFRGATAQGYSIGNSVPVEVSVNGQTRKFLARQKSLSNGKKAAPIELRTVERKRIVAGNPVEWVVNTYKLDGNGDLKEVGLARVATDYERKFAEGNAAPQETPKKPRSQMTSKELREAEKAKAATSNGLPPGFVRVQHGVMDAIVRQADLDGNAPQLRTYTKDGKGKQGFVKRENVQRVEAAQKVATATHADPGEAPEAVTPAVIAEAAKTADRAPTVSMAEARKTLLAQIDAAIKAAPNEGVLDNPPTTAVKKQSGKKTWEVDIARTVDGLKVPTLTIVESYDGNNYSIGLGGKVLPVGHRDNTLSREGSLLAARLMAARMQQGATWKAEGKAGAWAFTPSPVAATDMLTLDVPGDGTFKVLNTKERLTAFRKQVESFFKLPKQETPKPESLTVSQAARDKIMAEAEQVPEGEKRFGVPNPPTWDYRLKQRGGSTYLIPPVGQAFTPETRRALRDWARDAGYSASIITDNEISIAAVTGGPPLDYIVDGVKEQAYGRQVDKERAAVIEHNGTRIYQARIRSGEEVVTRFAVESADNKARREGGERTIGGDSLHATLDAAKNAADMERKQKEQEQANDAAQKAASDAKAQADAARKADDLNGFTATMSAMQAGKVKAALDKQVRFDGVVMTLRERVESLHSDGTLSVETFEEPAIKPMTRTQYNRATQREQDAHEAKMKAAGNKTVYLVNESDIGKTAYDYAQYLLAAQPAPSQQQADRNGVMLAKATKATKQQIAEREESTTGTLDGQMEAAPAEVLHTAAMGAIQVGDDDLTAASRRASRDWLAKLRSAVNQARSATDMADDARYNLLTSSGDLIAGVLRDEATYGKAEIDRAIKSIRVYAKQAGIESMTDALAAPKPAAQAASEPAAKIEDFGETLHGARKHYAQGYADRMKEAEALDVASNPLSKTWPEPDYEKLLEGGADPAIVAWVHAARDEIPQKPVKSWKQKGWAESVKLLREVSARLLDGSIGADRLQEVMEAEGHERIAARVGGRAALYQEVGHGVDLKGVTLEKHTYVLYRGEKNVTKWSVEKPAKATAFSNWPQELGVGDTRDEAIAAFKANLAKVTPQAKDKQPLKFVIYSYRGKPGFVIGKKVGKQHIDVQTFDTVKDAREYLSNNQEALEAKFKKLTDIPFERRETNEPRIGVDHRNGADVRPEQLSETFGFRGVQFGNYVEGKRRQQDLNNAYDALLDMAGVLGIPPRSLSLNGTLGLAFGARGKGGKNPAAAHYEPDTVVINLTKVNGAGSLAHEWWHGLDNYFGVLRDQSGKYGRADTYLTETAMSRPDLGPAASGGVRPEMVKAFNDVANVVERTGIKERSKNLDKRRTKAYWSTGREMTARSFESYIIARLADQNAANDYLANVVSEEAFGVENGYPYPTVGELAQVRAAYDAFFDTIESRETDNGNVALESVTTSARQDSRPQPQQSTDPNLPNNDAELRIIAREFSQADGMADSDKLGLRKAVNAALGGYPPVNVTYLRGEEGLDGIAKPGYVKRLQDQRASRDSKARTAGLYLRASETVDGKPRVVLFTDVANTPTKAMFTAAHEIAGHHGLRSLLGLKLNTTLARAYQNPTVKAVADAIYKSRGIDANVAKGRYTAKEGRLLAIEEALADLAAANRMGRYEEIQTRHGVTVLLTQQKGLKATIARAIEAIKAIFRAKNVRFTDAQVHSLLEASWKAAQDRSASFTSLNADGTLEQVVFHGTPHTVDKFSLNKIGTGEGAQAFGWGAYFASSKDIADHYRKGLTERDFINQARDAYDEFDSPDDAIEALREIPGLSGAQVELLDALQADGWLGFDYPHQAISAALRQPQNFELSPETEAAIKKQGNLYRVDVPDDSDLLDWDKPLSEQPKKVRAALQQAASPKGFGQIGARDADRFANVVQGASFRAKGYRGLDVPSQRIVLKGMREVVNNLKVFDAVVPLIPVDMVNVLRGKEFASEKMLHDPSVFLNLLSAEGRGGVALSVDAANSAIRRIADAASAEMPGVRDESVRVPKDFLAALSAGDFDQLAGSKIYGALSNELGSAENASNYLMSIGVSGTRYLDGTSRTKGEGSANYVIWDESAIGQPQSALESVSDDTRDTYNARIDALFKGDKAALKGVRILDRSDVLGMMGLGEGPMNIAEGKVIEGRYNHKLTAADWKKVPGWLENPALVFQSEQGDGSRLVFIAPETVGGEIVRMIVQPNAKNGADVHLLVNAYDAAGGNPLLRWAQDDLLRYVDTKKSPALAARSGRRLPGLADKPRGSAQTILSQKDLGKYLAEAGQAAVIAPPSSALESTEDQTQSEAFKRWFGDSKVVDADGKPLVVYHGTNKDFSKFKDGPVWFHTDPQQAFASGEGANVMPAYVKIERPIRRSGYFGMEDFSDPARFKFFDKAAGQWVTPDGVIGDNGVVVAFSPKQIKSATGNRGTFDPNEGSILESVESVGDALASAGNSIRNVKLPAGYLLADLFGKQEGASSLSWWSKTVGTQYDLAQRSPLFKRVFDSVQNMVADISHYANAAMNLAPDILPKFDSIKDAFKKRPMSAADAKKVSDAVFQGTKDYTRDVNGEAVKTSDVSKAGIVWTAEELRSRFNATGSMQSNGKYDGQIGLYEQARAAIDRSLDDTAVTQMIRHAGEDGNPVRDEMLAAGNAQAAAEILSRHLADQIKLMEGDTRSKSLQETADQVQEIAKQIDKLKAKGYAPLSRFGRYTVYRDGDNPLFLMFETPREANRAARMLREKAEGNGIKTGVMSQEQFKLFKGMTPETLELFGEMLGMDKTSNEKDDLVFQTFLKAAKSNRSALKRLIHRQGIEGYSQDLPRVLAAFLYSNARLAATNLHAPETQRAINDIPKEQGDLKDAAIRLNEYIVNPDDAGAFLSGFNFAQYLGGSIASAMVNMTQPLTMSFPWLSQYGGARKAAKALGDAMWLVGKGGDTGNRQLDEALKRADTDGHTQPQEVHQLQSYASGNGVLRTGDGTKAGDAIAMALNAKARAVLAWGIPFSLAEQFNRRATFIAAFNMATEQDMADPYGFAVNAVQTTQGIYNKANKPAWARNAIGGLAFTFKTYSINYVEMLHRMWTKGGPQGKKGVLLAVATMFLLAGAGGLPGADDLDDLIDGLMQRLGYNFSSKQEREAFFANLIGEQGAAFMEHGLSSIPGMPVDVSGRLGMGNLIPSTGLFVRKADHSRDIAEIAGPTGDFIKRSSEAFDQLTEGNLGASMLAIAPRAAANVWKGIEMAETGEYRDTRGRKVLETTTGEAIAKGIGFQPASVAKVQQASGAVMDLMSNYRIVSASIADRWAKGIYEQDPGEVLLAQKELADWNAKNPDMPIRIGRNALRSRVRNLAMDRRERLSKATPKAVRAQVETMFDARTGRNRAPVEDTE